MGKINSVSGLNTMAVDWRPETQQVQPNAAPQQPVQPEEGPKVRQSAKSIVRELDVLLLNAAGKSVSANAAQKVKETGALLVENKILTKKELKNLVSLADNATQKLKALDNFSGEELAQALMPDGEKALTWRTGLLPADPGAKAAKAAQAAIEAQQKLSEAIGALTDRLLASDKVDFSLKDAFIELGFQADRRATEINSILLRMYDLHQQDVANGGASDPKTKALLSATFAELMPREAILMHGTADALEKMKAKLGPLAEKLDSFAADPNKMLSGKEMLALQADIATMKNAVADVRNNGIKIGDGRIDVDKDLLSAMDKVLDEAAESIKNAKKHAAATVRTAFINDLERNLSPNPSKPAPSLDTLSGSARSAHKAFSSAKRDFIDLFTKAAEGKITMAKFDADINKLAKKLAGAIPTERVRADLGFDDRTIGKIKNVTSGIKVAIAQFKEIMRTTNAAIQTDDEASLSSGDIRRILLGEQSISSVVEARSRGFKAKDADPALDGANIVSSKPLGSGAAGSTFIATTKAGGEYVFKPELEGRLGLNRLVLAENKAYLETQNTANLNLATKDAAKMLGAEDVVVDCSVGSLDGQFGLFMEKAQGGSGANFARKESTGTSLNTNEIRALPDAERERIRGQTAKKLNKLQWLDLITGQLDRHWNNYFVHVDKTTHEVTVKGIDNDASFPAYRTGLQRYTFDETGTKEFFEALEELAEELHGDMAKTELRDRIKNDPSITRNPDGTVTIDLTKAKAPEIGITLYANTGSQSLSLPPAIDKDTYDHLMALDSDPAKKQAYLDSIAPRISPKALDAAKTRLDEAIAHAKNLATQGKVFTDADWNNTAKLRRTHNPIPQSVSVLRTDGNSIELDSANDSVRNYLTNITTSYFRRDYFSSL